MNNKSKFNSFSEAVMRLILVPDDTSDTAGVVEPMETEPEQDTFTQTANNYFSQAVGDPEPLSAEDGPECDGSPEECEADDLLDSDDGFGVEEDDGIAVSKSDEGIVLSINNIQITIPSTAVKKIAELYQEENPEDTEEEEDSENPEHEAEETEAEETEERETGEEDEEYGEETEESESEEDSDEEKE